MNLLLLNSTLPTLATQDKDLLIIVPTNQKRHVGQRKWTYKYRCIDWLLYLNIPRSRKLFFWNERKGQTEVETGDQNMHNHLLQEHFLRTFPNEGPGSVNLSLIRKQSRPKEVLGTGRCLKKLRERPGNLKPASMNSIMPLAHSFPPSSPSLCFSPSLSSFQAPKQKFYPK